MVLQLFGTHYESLNQKKQQTKINGVTATWVAALTLISAGSVINAPIYAQQILVPVQTYSVSQTNGLASGLTSGLASGLSCAHIRCGSGSSCVQTQVGPACTLAVAAPGTATSNTTPAIQAGQATAEIKPRKRKFGLFRKRVEAGIEDLKTVRNRTRNHRNRGGGWSGQSQIRNARSSN